MVHTPNDLQLIDGASNVVTNHFQAIIHAGSELESLVIDELARCAKAAFFGRGGWME